MTPPGAANPPYKLPRPIFDARCKACWLTCAAMMLVVASVVSLDLQWAPFLSVQGWQAMARFVGEFFPPDLTPTFLRQVLAATWETLAMSALGTVLATLGGAALALPVGRQTSGRKTSGRQTSGRQPSGRHPADPTTHSHPWTRLVSNGLRSIPELVWAGLLLIAVGLGPFAGTLALAIHTTGVLGRLFVETLENLPDGPAAALRAQGVGAARVFLYATLPQAAPQWASYTLYRWENNIRAAAVLGVVGAGGLGQLLTFHMGLFHMHKTATILAAMLLLVGIVDVASAVLRRALTR